MKICIILFIIGLVGYIINHKSNIIILYISIELMLLGITLMIIITGKIQDDMIGLLFGIIMLIITGIESTIGLSILIYNYRLKGFNEIEI